MTQPRRVNYLNNKDILKEIHKSKLTYCYIQDDKFANVDLIVDSVKKINKTAIKQAQENKAAKMQTLAYQTSIAEGNWTKKPKQKDFAVDPKSLPVDELVFRVMTFDHIPDEPGRKKTTKTVADTASTDKITKNNEPEYIKAFTCLSFMVNKLYHIYLI